MASVNAMKTHTPGHVTSSPSIHKPLFGPPPPSIHDHVASEHIKRMLLAVVIKNVYDVMNTCYG